jgi:LPXTG-motif cell wall-anchored protein
MLPGPHTLVVTGTTAQGKAATMSVGILVTAGSGAFTQGAGVVVPAAGTSWWWLLVGAAVLGLGLFFLVWRRRKQDDEEPSAA